MEPAIGSPDVRFLTASHLPHCATLMFPDSSAVRLHRQARKMPFFRSAFIALSKNRHLRHLGERSSLGIKLSSRFVAGMEIEDALRVAEAVNKQGVSVSLDSLGESVTSEAEAHRAAEVYH